MDIPALSMDMSYSKVMDKVGVAMLSKTLDTMETLGDGMTKMMEASVNPHIGQNFDVSV